MTDIEKVSKNVCKFSDEVISEVGLELKKIRYNSLRRDFGGKVGEFLVDN